MYQGITPILRSVEGKDVKVIFQDGMCYIYFKSNGIATHRFEKIVDNDCISLRDLILTKTLTYVDISKIGFIQIES